MTRPEEVPLIVAYFEGSPEVKCLSNFAETPFELDGIQYQCVEGFWQSLKTEYPAFRAKFYDLNGLDAKRLGQEMIRQNSSSLFTYMGNIYKVGSPAHHILLERAIRAKVAQNPDVREALINSGQRRLVHLLANRFGGWRSGDSAALPAVTFERILTTIRSELQLGSFSPTLELPSGINEFQ